MSTASECSSFSRGPLSHWLADRDARFLVTRSASLLKRYGVGSGRGKRRILRAVEDLGERGGLPTYPTPGRTVERNVAFFRRLSSLGVELAVHSYDHVDFRGISTKAALEQLERAADLFERLGIPVEGFRCPYLGYTDELLDAIPAGMFSYSSNKSILWQQSVAAEDGGSSLYESLGRFYSGASSSVAVALPHDCGNLIEIPLSVPDDLQLSDGLGLGAKGVMRAWGASFEQTYERGELFAPLCHPEAYDRCADAFRSILDVAGARRPRVWVAQLRDIARWWRERSAARAETERLAAGVRVHVHRSPREAVLARGLPSNTPAREWDDRYRALESSTFELPTDAPRPFVGLARDVPSSTVVFLREAGYLIDQDSTASECTVFLDRATVKQVGEARPLLERIEASEGPLVKLSVWPDGARSAFCIAGDLDALSLLDYLARMLRLSLGGGNAGAEKTRGRATVGPEAPSRLAPSGEAISGPSRSDGTALD